MSANVITGPTEPNQVNPQAQPPQQAVDAAQNVTMATTVSSINDLKKQAPKIYDAMLLGIATSIVTKIKHNQDRLKEMMRDWRRWTDSN